MKLLLAVLALGVAAPASAGDPEFQGRKGNYFIEFSDITRNADTTWSGAEVTFTGPDSYKQYFTATFDRTDHGEILVEGDPCKIVIDTVADDQGMDAGWKVTLVSYDDDKTGCEVLPAELQGTYTPS